MTWWQGNERLPLCDLKNILDQVIESVKVVQGSGEKAPSGQCGT